MKSGVLSRTELLTCLFWFLTPDSSGSGLPPGSSSSGLSPTKEVLSCLFPKATLLASSPPQTDFGAHFFTPLLQEVIVEVHAHPSLISSQVVREYLEFCPTIKAAFVFREV